MNFNLQCDKFKNNLIKMINQSDLPIAVIYYIFQNIFNQVEKTYIGTVNQIALEQQRESIKNLKEEIEQKKNDSTTEVVEIEEYKKK